VVGGQTMVDDIPMEWQGRSSHVLLVEVQWMLSVPEGTRWVHRLV